MIVHDDVLATGGTAKAKVDLVEQLGGEVVGLLFVIELTFLNGSDKLDGLRRPVADLVLRPRPAVSRSYPELASPTSGSGIKLYRCTTR